MSARARRNPPFLRRRRRDEGLGGRGRRLLVVAALLLAVASLLVGESGWIELGRQRSELRRLDAELESLRARQALREAQLAELARPGSFELERVARDVYGLRRPDERVLHVVESNEPASP